MARSFAISPREMEAQDDIFRGEPGLRPGGGMAIEPGEIG
jgi:hypothetical protein